MVMTGQAVEEMPLQGHLAAGRGRHDYLSGHSVRLKKMREFLGRRPRRLHHQVRICVLFISLDDVI